MIFEHQLSVQDSQGLFKNAGTAFSDSELVNDITELLLAEEGPGAQQIATSLDVDKKRANRLRYAYTARFV
jgi:hypothetical protein